MTEQAVAGGVVGMVGQDLYRAEPKRTRFATTQWIGADAAAVALGALIGTVVNLARRLVNASPDHLYPESFAEEAAAIAGRTGLVGAAGCAAAAGAQGPGASAAQTGLRALERPTPPAV